MTKRRIMILDDDTEFLEEMQEMLTSTGYDTAAFPGADSALQAVKMVQTAKPDVLLLDLKMGDINGFEVAELLAHLPETAGIPIIAITGFYTENQYSHLMTACGIRTCLTKPFCPSDLIAQIRLVLEPEERQV